MLAWTWSHNPQAGFACIIIYCLFYRYYMQMLMIAPEIYLLIVRNLVWSLCSSFRSTELTNVLTIFHFEQAISAMSNAWSNERNV